jgi:hypothetical protein
MAETPAQWRRRLRAQLLTKLELLVRAGRRREALPVVIALARLEPGEPRWPRRYGDLMRSIGRPAAAARAYVAAGRRYSIQGFAPRAAAMTKLASQVAASACERQIPGEK